MKSLIKAILLFAPILGTVATSQQAWAYNNYDFKADGFYFNILPEGNTVELTCEDPYNDAHYTTLKGAVTIPSSVTYNGKTYKVTAIGWRAFEYCYNIKSVTIPNTVTRIGGFAFGYCQGLTSINLGDSVTTIGDEAFMNCISMNSITIPNTVTTIGKRAFMFSNIKSIVLSNSLTAISESTFECTGLTSITIPNSVSYIGTNAFANSFLKSIDIGNSVSYIGTGAFSSCTHLGSIDIPNTVTTIYDGAFSGCTGLISVNLPSSMAEIKSYVFSGCTSLTDINIPNSVTTISKSAFENCSGLTEINLPNSITNIGEKAFYCCSGLTELTIPSSVTAIGNEAFSGCSNMTRVNVTDLAKWCGISFAGKTANPLFFNKTLCVNGVEMHDLVIPDAVSKINDFAFYGANLSSIIIPSSVTTVGECAFNTILLKTLTLCGGIKNVGSNAFYFKINTLNLLPGVTSVKGLGINPDTIYSYAEEPPMCDANSFTAYTATLVVPKAFLAYYFLDDYWGNFTTINSNAVLAQAVRLDFHSRNMRVGESGILVASVDPQNATGASVTWHSTNDTVANVNNGIVTALAPGECDVIVNCLHLADTCHLTVTQESSIVLRFNRPVSVLKTNTIDSITYSVTPNLSNYPVVISNSAPDIVFHRVRNNGRIDFVGLNPGKATLTATLAGVPEGVTVVPATCEITVVALEATDSVTHDKHNPAEYLSGTLPVLYVNTAGEKEIISKEEYLDGTYYLDAQGIEGYENIGSAEAPLALKIKGRGNITWGYDKKPYRLKFDKKASPLGMKKSKHFVLLANCEEGPLSLYKDVLGLWLGKQLGLDWTPDIKPVELVINGDYRGLYNLAEQVRVDPDRVNVVEQDDGETAPELVTGGWLVEIDNYDAPAYASDDGGQVINQTNSQGGDHDDGTTQAANSQVVMRTRADGSLMRFTPKTPEVLSEVQRAYLIDLVLAVDSLINVEDKSDRAWEELIDLDALARYYLVNEVMCDVEAFNANCYWHKERGDDAKMVFGPVWDFGAAADEWTLEQESFLYNNEYMMPFRPNHWIGEIAKFPRFQQRVKAHWSHYVNGVHSEMASKLVQYYQTIATAATDGDYRRWPQYDGNGALSAARSVLQHVEQHYNWLITQWGHCYPGDVNGDDVVSGADVTALYNVLLNDAPAAGNADVNDDGVVNGADVTALYNLLLN